MAGEINGEVPTVVRKIAGAGVTMSGVTMNGVTMNGATIHGVVMNGVVMNGVAIHGVATHGGSQKKSGAHVLTYLPSQPMHPHCLRHSPPQNLRE